MRREFFVLFTILFISHPCSAMSFLKHYIVDTFYQERKKLQPTEHCIFGSEWTVIGDENKIEKIVKYSFDKTATPDKFFYDLSIFNKKGFFVENKHYTQNKNSFSLKSIIRTFSEKRLSELFPKKYNDHIMRWHRVFPTCSSTATLESLKPILMMLIHGTFGNKNPKYYDPEDPDFKKFLQHALDRAEHEKRPVDILLWNWCGSNNSKKRLEAGVRLGEFLDFIHSAKEVEHSVYELLSVFGHSQGCNVGHIATHTAKHAKINEFYEFGCPYRIDDKKEYIPKNVSVLFNFLSYYDLIQLIGSIIVHRYQDSLYCKAPCKQSFPTNENLYAKLKKFSETDDYKVLGQFFDYLMIALSENATMIASSKVPIEITTAVQAFKKTFNSTFKKLKTLASMCKTSDTLTASSWPWKKLKDLAGQALKKLSQALNLDIGARTLPQPTDGGIVINIATINNGIEPGHCELPWIVMPHLSDFLLDLQIRYKSYRNLEKKHQYEVAHLFKKLNPHLTFCKTHNKKKPYVWAINKNASVSPENPFGKIIKANKEEAQWFTQQYKRSVEPKNNKLLTLWYLVSKILS